MSVSGLESILRSIAPGQIDRARVDQLVTEANDDAQVTSGERAVLLGALDTFESRFDPDAKLRLQQFLQVAQGPGQKKITFIYDAGDKPLSNVRLNGSWNKQTGAFSSDWGSQTLSMEPLGDGRWAATVDINDDGQTHDWQWGVVADGPSGQQQWAVMGEGNLPFDPNKPATTYSPTTHHSMGVHRVGTNGIRWKVWAPHAQSVTVRVTSNDGVETRVPMTRDSENRWVGQLEDKFQQMLGSTYVYEVIDSSGNSIDRPDPYAREMQGEQRGIGRSYFDPTTGKEVHAFSDSKQEFVRFEIGNEASYDRAYLVLKAADGTPLSKADVLARIGNLDPNLAAKIQQDRGLNDLGALTIEDDGRIRMQNEGGTWTTFLNNPDALVGLRYELQVWSKDSAGKLYLHDDKNRDNVFSAAERKASPNNDPWDDLISKDSGLEFRGSIVTDTRFDWRNDNVAREKDPSKWIVYQLHVGSFFGMQMNSKRSTFEDITHRLDYLKDLGINTIELLPINEVEGNRDWGYMGVNSLATESAYGFEDSSGKWVTGTEALKKFIDEAHARGLNVMNDVVYNHVGGNHNLLWQFDGPENEYFNWSKNPGRSELRGPTWGSLPAFNNEKVKQFYVDHAVAQIEELHFDGLRFDFTEPIKAEKFWQENQERKGGGTEGWNLLREINRQLEFAKPGTFTVAEQFDYDPSMTQPVRPDGTGAGFDAQWYTEYQHRLVNDATPFNPGLTQAAARGWRTDIDKFLQMLAGPRGLADWRHALSIISNHDEVGNAQRTITVAEGNSPSNDPGQWARNAARFAAGIGLVSPGIPMFFQGEESQARNEFKWGKPTTWDLGWGWEALGKNWDWRQLHFNEDRRALYTRLSALPEAVRHSDSAFQALTAVDQTVCDDLARLSVEERAQAFIDIPRRQSVEFFKDAIALRKSSAAFSAAGAVTPIYSHNDNSVLAFTRSGGGDEFLVIGSLNKNKFDPYLFDLPPGTWKEVFNSDAAKYGGTNVGNGGGSFSNKAALALPAAGYVVFKKTS